jgi:cytochrome c peroxidase
MKSEDKDSINRIYANSGKAVAAYVRQMLPQPALVDQYVDAIVRNDLETAQERLSPDAVEGLMIFIRKAKCTNCHMGPLLANSSFHNIGKATLFACRPIEDPIRSFELLPEQCK